MLYKEDLYAHFLLFQLKGSDVLAENGRIHLHVELSVKPQMIMRPIISTAGMY